MCGAWPPTEPPPDASMDAPECAWCPICRAARRVRESGPGLSGPLAGAGDVVAAAVQEALSAFDSVLSMRPRTEPADRPSPARPGPAGPAGKPDSRAAGAPRKGRIMSLTIGVDVGGTKVAAGVVDQAGRIVEKLKRSTPAASPEQTAARHRRCRARAARPPRGRRRRHRRRRFRRRGPLQRAVRAQPGLAGRAAEEAGRGPDRRARSSWRTTRTPPPGPRPSSARPAGTSTSCSSRSAPASAPGS